MNKKKVDFKTIKKALERKYPYKVGAGAILKGISTEQVLKGYFVAYSQDYKQKVYCTFKYIVYNGNIYAQVEE